MPDVVTIDRFGRLVLPQSVRKALKMTVPAAFRVEVVGNKVELSLVPPSRGAILKKRKGILVVSTGGKKFDAGEAVQALREERV